MYTIKPKCDMLIDQTKFIDSDPIGHCCFNDAEFDDGEYFICSDCMGKIKSGGDHNVTIPIRGSVKFFRSAVSNYFDERKVK